MLKNNTMKHSLEVKHDAKIRKKEEEEDSYGFVYFLLFLLGMVCDLPWTFFATANDYWMYKFRNTSSDMPDSAHRTTLQKIFTPSLTCSFKLSTTAFLSLALFYGHKLSTHSKLYGPLTATLSSLTAAAVFILIDTDKWQISFFVVTMFIIFTISASTSVLSMGIYSLLSNFPTKYLAAVLTGGGMAQMFTSSLQMVSLTVGLTTKGSALVYFWAGVGVILFSLIMTVSISKCNRFYRCCYQNIRKDVDKRKILTCLHIKNVLRKIWPCILTTGFSDLTNMSVYPTITSLVVPDGEGPEQWKSLYFIPVTNFVLFAFGDYTGRIIGLKLKSNINVVWLIAFSALRMVLFIPLLILCNAQPRKHLPVIFTHDYQFILIMVAFSLSHGYVLCTTSLAITRLVPLGELEDAYHVNMVAKGILSAVLSFLGFIFVEVL